MKTLATATLWLLAAWVSYDIAAFATGMPRSVTPLVACAIGVLAGLILVSRSRSHPFAMQTRSQRALPKT